MPPSSSTLPRSGPVDSGRRQPAGPERPLKVCLASLAPFVGGAEVAAERLAIGLREAGHEVVMVLGRTGPVQERMERAGLRCVVAPMHMTDKWHWWRWLRSRGALRQMLRRERPDVLHSNDLPTHQVLSAAARGLGIPRVCHHRFPFGGTAIDWLNKFGAERHLFVSRALMEALCGESQNLARSERAVVHDGLELPPAPSFEDRRRARKRLGLAEDRAIVTFAGQIIERKGVADILRAWMMLAPSTREQADLLIVGDDLQGQGAYRATMQEMSASLGCPARFVGFRSDVGDWLTASDVAVVPSLVEPLGNATLEAMACGLPVVGSAVGGIPEMVVDGQTGLLVPPQCPEKLAEAIGRLIDEPETRARYGEAGRRRCETLFSLEAHCRGVLGEYDRVLARNTQVATS
jgi:glycosyltransferase involved in cell wall biosynthesis